MNGTRDDTPRIFLYDAYPGGIGLSAPLWSMQPELLSSTSALIAGCDCDTGCPMCVGPIGETGPLAKTVALRILQHLQAASLGDGSATAEAVALPTQRKCRSSMVTLDRLRDIVRDHGPSTRSDLGCIRGRWRATALAVA